LSRSGGHTEVVTLLLTDIGINPIAGAGMAFLTFLATTSTREQIVFWQLGTQDGALWAHNPHRAPLAAVGLAVAPLEP
ncbi:iron chelate uptake ABC transporter family permease subunit, partial [Microbacterium sp. GbtcB4]|uniref:iron chelate uptake ABC transporter family permease subunit n=1 Tax=Microbacterium sp. GbtcB4 TaxID=2824749 RepID=UPI001C31160D